ncbi:MAG: glycine C-acetyltransferase [Flavobacteriaceae bacterium]|nr:glycine C-acetyltransferase [Bacteroidota bacterium]
MPSKVKESLQEELSTTKASGLYKTERIITTPQRSAIQTTDTDEVINFCANNYLGLSSNPEIIQAAKTYLDSHGFGLSSVRFICGTQDIHKELEAKTAAFLGMEDCILYAAAFDANGGLFEPLLSEQDAVISDALNHASIIDGIRLCKAKRYRYQHNDMDSLEQELIKAKGSRRKLIVTDGCFSMDGTIAQLNHICDLAEKYEALVMIDECHATGFMGQIGRGTHEHHHVMDRVDIITGTYGKALGGATGGFTAASKEIIAILRQNSRPYLFSNAMAPSIVGASIKVLELISSTTKYKDQLDQNTQLFRSQMADANFDIIPGTHPIVPIMLYDAKKAQEFAAALLQEGIYVIGFFYPVVPKNLARIRVQLSAAHSDAQIHRAVEAFIRVRKKLNY